MTAQILHMRDYKSPEERQIESERIGLKVASEALGVPIDFPIQYRSMDTAPSEMDSGDCA